ncbi:MAG: hypothetical protein ACRDZ1_10775 [Acidimicrobiia bacterium]
MEGDERMVRHAATDRTVFGRVVDLPTSVREDATKIKSAVLTLARVEREMKIPGLRLVLVEVTRFEPDS